jgi:hypothetical protein
MELEHRKDLLLTMEKTAHKSKKFVAWFIMQVFLFVMALYALKTQPELGWPLAGFMTAIVFSMCVSTMWIIGKQAAADIAIRGYALIGGASEKIKEAVVQGEAAKA